MNKNDRVQEFLIRRGYKQLAPQSLLRMMFEAAKVGRPRKSTSSVQKNKENPPIPVSRFRQLMEAKEKANKKTQPRMGHIKY